MRHAMRFLRGTKLKIYATDIDVIFLIKPEI